MLVTQTFYTIGHSTRTSSQFIDLLRVGGVEHVVDVRAMPRSRANPQFNADALTSRLADSGIEYSHSVALAGLRSRDERIADTVNGYWRNRSFHNYADYALSACFRDGLDSLTAQGRDKTCAIMCSEAVWWRCHRRIIADHLIHRGFTVFHLMGDDRVQLAELNPGASVASTGDLIYPA